jgi:uncharacterized membrane protein
LSCSLLKKRLVRPYSSTNNGLRRHRQLCEHRDTALHGSDPCAAGPSPSAAAQSNVGRYFSFVSKYCTVTMRFKWGTMKAS